MVLACASLFARERSAFASDLDAFSHWASLPSPLAMEQGQQIQLTVVDNALLAIPTNAAAGSIEFLSQPDGKWTVVKRPSGVDWQAVSAACGSTATHATYLDRLICLGKLSNSDDVISLRFKDGAFYYDPFPPLPTSFSNCRGAVLDHVLYVLTVSQMNGQQTSFLKLDLRGPSDQFRWETLSPPACQIDDKTTLVAVDGSLLLFNCSAETDRALQALRGAWSWNVAKGWSAISTFPGRFDSFQAIPIGQTHALLVDDTARRALYYHSITDTWRRSEIEWENQLDSRNAEPGLPVAITKWRGGIAIAGSGAIFLGMPQRRTQALAGIDIAVIGVYLLLLIALGAAFARREQTSQDYFCAGQRIPWWAAGISLLGTSLSAITFMAFPATAYRTDWVYLLGNFMIVAVAAPVVWYYLPFFRRLNVTSAYEYLERRFGLTTRLVGSATFLLFQITRMAVVVYLPALGLSAVSGWNIYACIGAIGLLATFYTTLGGIEAVIWTDVLQVIVLLCGALISIFIILSKIPGGASPFFSSALAEGKLHSVNLTWDAASTGIWVVLVGNFFKFLIPYSSDQAVIQRYLTTRDEKQAAKSIWLNALASIPVWTIFFALGTLLWGFYRSFPDRLDPMGRTDEIFAWFIVKELPPGISGLVVAALMAASMSSLDSSLNSMATAITTDFYRRYRERGRSHESTLRAARNDNVNERSYVDFARRVTFLLGVVGTLMAAWLAWLDELSIWDLFLALTGLLGGGLAGMFVAGIFTRRVNQTGVLVGFLASVVTLYVARESGAVHFFLYGGIGIVTCLVVSWLTCLFVINPQKSIEGLTIYSLPKRIA